MTELGGETEMHRDKGVNRDERENTGKELGGDREIMIRATE